MNQSGNFFTFTYGGIIICQKDRIIKVLYINESEQKKTMCLFYTTLLSRYCFFWHLEFHLL